MGLTANSLVSIPKPLAVQTCQIQPERLCQALYTRPESFSRNLTHFGDEAIRERLSLCPPLLASCRNVVGML